MDLSITALEIAKNTHVTPDADDSAAVTDA